MKTAWVKITQKLEMAGVGVVIKREYFGEKEVEVRVGLVKETVASLAYCAVCRKDKAKSGKH